MSAVAIGDSIAVGTGAAAHIQTHAQVGASSCAIVHMVPGGAYDVAVISAGINDPPGHCLEDIRARINARRIIWILPAPINSARAHVAAVAAEHGDGTVSYACAGGCSSSNFHPMSYSVLASAIFGK